MMASICIFQFLEQTCIPNIHQPYFLDRWQTFLFNQTSIGYYIACFRTGGPFIQKASIQISIVVKVDSSYGVLGILLVVLKEPLRFYKLMVSYKRLRYLAYKN